MRILLTILLGLYILLTSYSCGVRLPVETQRGSDKGSGYEIVIKFFELGYQIDKVVDVFNMNGLVITDMQQTYLSNERQEMRIKVKGGDMRQINDSEYQLRGVLNVETISINRL